MHSCIIKIRVIEARNLPKMDSVGWCDPYFTIRIGSQTQKTTIIKNNANPKYNAEFTFDVKSANTRIVEVSCFDWDRLSTDELISSFFIPFEEFENDSPIIKWFSLGDKKGEVFLDISADISLTRSFIPSSHPLVVRALYNYTPTPPEKPNEPVLDDYQQPLPKGFVDMELMEDCSYLLKRKDYPWAEWSSVVPLRGASSLEENIYYAGKDGASEHILALANPKNTLGGFAPTSYLDPIRLSNAHNTLLSNPDSFEQVLTALLVVPVKKLERKYIPASHPLVVFAAHSYAPPPPTGEDLTDLNGLPLEEGFTDIALEAEGGVYLLKQANYPWPDWCTLTPLRTAGAGEGSELTEGKTGLDAQLLYLANPRTAARGGFAPTSYIDPACAEAAQTELKTNPAAFAQAMALLTGSGSPEVAVAAK